MKHSGLALLLSAVMVACGGGDDVAGVDAQGGSDARVEIDAGGSGLADAGQDVADAAALSDAGSADAATGPDAGPLGDAGGADAGAGPDGPVVADASPPDGALADAGATTSPPVARDDTESTGEDAPLAIQLATLLANDDGDATLSVSAFDVTSLAGGTVTMGGGSLVYTPPVNYAGVDYFGYTVVDAAGTDSAVVAVTVSPVNDDPVAAADGASTVSAIAVDIHVLANDLDVDGDPMTVESIGPVANGTATDEGGGVIRYRSNAGYVGAESFSYTVNDGRGGTDTAMVTIDVAALPPGPVFAPALSTPTHGDALTWDEAFGSGEQLSPARFVFDNGDLDEAAVAVEVRFLSQVLTDGLDYEVYRNNDNEIHVAFLRPLDVHGALSQTGDPLTFALTNVRNVSGDAGADVTVAVIYDERAPNIEWRDVHGPASWRAIGQFDESMDPTSASTFTFIATASGAAVAIEPDGPDHRGRGFAKRNVDNDTFFAVPRDLLTRGTEYRADMSELTDVAGNRCQGNCSMHITPDGSGNEGALRVIRVELIDRSSQQVVASVDETKFGGTGFTLPDPIAGTTHDVRFVFNASLEQTQVWADARFQLPTGGDEFEGFVDTAVLPSDSVRFNPRDRDSGFTWRARAPWRARIHASSVGGASSVDNRYLFTVRGGSEAVAPSIGAVTARRRGGPMGDTPVLRPGDSLRVGFSEVIDPATLVAANFTVSGAGDPTVAVYPDSELRTVTLRAVDADGVPILLAEGAYTLTIAGLRDVAAEANNAPAFSVDFEVAAMGGDSASLVFTTPADGTDRLAGDDDRMSVSLGFSDRMFGASFVDHGDPSSTARGFRLDERIGDSWVPRKGFALDRSEDDQGFESAVVRLETMGGRLLDHETSYRLSLLPGLRNADGDAVAPGSLPAPITFTTAPNLSTNHNPAFDGIDPGDLQLFPTTFPSFGPMTLRTEFEVSVGIRDPDGGNSWTVEISTGGLTRVGASSIDSDRVELTLDATEVDALFPPGVTTSYVVTIRDNIGNSASHPSSIYRPSAQMATDATPVVAEVAGQSGVYAFGGTFATVSDASRITAAEVFIAEVDAGNSLVALTYVAPVALTTNLDGTVSYTHTMPPDSALAAPAAGNTYLATLVVTLESEFALDSEDGTTLVGELSAPFTP